MEPFDSIVRLCNVSIWNNPAALEIRTRLQVCKLDLIKSNGLKIISRHIRTSQRLIRPRVRQTEHISQEQTSPITCSIRSLSPLAPILVSKTSRSYASLMWLQRKKRFSLFASTKHSLSYTRCYSLIPKDLEDVHPSLWNCSDISLPWRLCSLAAAEGFGEGVNSTTDSLAGYS